MQIDTINNFFLKEYKNQKEKVENSREKPNPNVSISKEDVVINISNKGRVLSDQLQTVKSTMVYLNDTSDIRQDKLEDVKQKIKDGFYQTSSEVHHIIAEKILSLIKD